MGAKTIKFCLFRISNRKTRKNISIHLDLELADLKSLEGKGKEEREGGGVEREREERAN